jgi:hypothetical protein
MRSEKKKLREEETIKDLMESDLVERECGVGGAAAQQLFRWVRSGVVVG